MPDHQRDEKPLAEAAATTPPPPSGGHDARSPTRIALDRFWAKAGNRWLVAGALAFFALGIAAPLLASEVALIWISGDGEWHIPWLWDLFNRRSYDYHHDFIFNCYLLLLPVLVPVAWVLRRRLGGRNALLLPLGAPLLAAIFGMIPWPGAGSLWAERQSSPYVITAIDERDQDWALFTPLGHRWDATYAGAILKPPMSDNPHTGKPFVLGTDTRGRDVAVRMLAGARISITIGIIAAGLAFVIGTVVGAISGYLGGIIDIILQRIVEMVMTFPTLILLLLVASLISRNVFVLVTVIGLVSWTGTARLVRGEFLTMSEREFVLAARCLGYSRFRIMFRHILPNIMTPLLISLTFGVAGAVGLEAGLSFIGLGDPNAPSWGEILNQGRQNIQYYWLIYVPGLTIFAFICVLYAIGDQLREAFDPKG